MNRPSDICGGLVQDEKMRLSQTEDLSLTNGRVLATLDDNCVETPRYAHQTNPRGDYHVGAFLYESNSPSLREQRRDPSESHIAPCNSDGAGDINCKC